MKTQKKPLNKETTVHAILRTRKKEKKKLIINTSTMRNGHVYVCTIIQ